MEEESKRPANRPYTYDKNFISDIDCYIQTALTEEQIPSIEGFAIFEDRAGNSVTVRTLENWANREPEFFRALEKIKMYQKNELINKGLSGDYNSAIAKLILSANHGMREGKDITSDGKQIEGNTIKFEDFKK